MKGFSKEQIKQLEDAFKAWNNEFENNNNSPSYLTPLPFNAKEKVNKLLSFIK